jgi:hypothetical protein
MQPITSEQKHHERVLTHELTKDQAYDAAIEWIAKKFNSANDAVQLKDKENGKIIIQGVGSYYYDALQSVLLNYRYTMTVRVADNKVKFEFDTLSLTSGRDIQQGDVYKIQADYNLIMENMLQSFKNYKNDGF